MPLRKINVEVTHLTGKRLHHSFMAYEDPTISNLKMAVEEKWNIPHTRQTFVQDGGVQDDAQELEDGGQYQLVVTIDIGAIVSFILRLPSLRSRIVNPVAAEALSHLSNEDAVTDVVNAVAVASTTHLQPLVRSAMVDVLAELADWDQTCDIVSPNAITAIRQCLEDHNGGVRFQAVLGLSRLLAKGDEQARGAIRQCLEHDDVGVRFQAALALARHHSRGNDAIAAIAALKGCCAIDDDADWHRATIEEVAKLSGRGDIDNILFVAGHLHDAHVQTRLAAVKAMALIGVRDYPVVVASLRRLLVDDFTDVVLGAVEALKELADPGDPCVINSLNGLLEVPNDDPGIQADGDVLAAARQALNVLA